MFFFLSKALLFLLSPFTWIILLVVAAFWLKSDKWRKRSKAASIFCLLFFSNNVIFKEACRLWEIPGTPIEKVTTHDVGILLGGMFEYNGDLKRLSARRGADRVWQTLSLYKLGKIKTILISGDNGYLFDNKFNEAKQLRLNLIELGIPDSAILTDVTSKNTFENAVQSKLILQQNKLTSNRLLLITSGLHMKRASACFEHTDLSCTPFSTDLYTGPTRYYSFDDYFMPDVTVVNDWHKLIKEIFGYVTYSLTDKL